ncbi:hypothetical protein D9M71_768130 [compost metagenome]
MQHLLVALGGHQADLGAAAGQDGVGRDRGAVHHRADLGGIDARGLADLLDAIEHGDGGIVRRGRHLGGIAVTCDVVDQEQVSEGSAYINTQTKTHVASKHFLGFVVHLGPGCISTPAVSA